MSDHGASTLARDAIPAPPDTGGARPAQSPLVSTRQQIDILNRADLSNQVFSGDFELALARSTEQELRAGEIDIFQINLGKLCNMSCRHCHVDAGPDRLQVMTRATVDACLQALDRTRAHTVDITGGAPELNPSFRYLVDECVKRGMHIIDRCNLTVLLLPEHRELPEWLAARGVEIVCSLPHFRRRNTDAQRGQGTYALSLEALARLNRAGYGKGHPQRLLTLMVNPVGAYLTGDQQAMEREWKQTLTRRHQLSFDRLIALNNMPIARYLEWLEASNNLQRYLELLVSSFNPTTVVGLMCRKTLSVSWDGRIFDCDFNQMLDLECRVSNGRALRISELDPEQLRDRRIVTGRHCFGCTAGAGSSCGGALD